MANFLDDPDGFLLHWKSIAATAYHGFLLKGRGVVVVGSDATFTYELRPKICDCCDALVASYDPATSVVVALDGEVFQLSGWPSPEEAYAESSAESVSATVQ